MSRFFNGGTALDSITFSGGTFPPDEGPITVAALAKPNGTSFVGWLLNGHDGTFARWSTLAVLGSMFMENDFSSGVSYGSTAWFWLVATKASGNVPPRWHIRNVTSAGAWSHTDASANVGDNTGSANVIILGNHIAGGASDSWRGWVAAAATWASELSDGQVEAACTLAASDLLAASPGWMVRLNQASTATSVTDDTGHGGNQSAISGTSVDSDEPPGWSYSLGGTTHNADGTLAGTGALSGTVTYSTSATGTLAGTGALSGTAGLASAAPATGNGWFALKGILDESRAMLAEDRAMLPVACPNDGEPLRTGPDGYTLYCPFDGWRPNR